MRGPGLHTERNPISLSKAIPDPHPLLLPFFPSRQSDREQHGSPAFQLISGHSSREANFPFCLHRGSLSSFTTTSLLHPLFHLIFEASNMLFHFFFSLGPFFSSSIIPLEMSTGGLVGRGGGCMCDGMPARFLPCQ